MKVLFKYICTFSILLMYHSIAYTQTLWIDSVKKVLFTQKEDTTKIATLLNLSLACRFSYPDSSLAYAQTALLLAEKINSDENVFWSLAGINQSLFILGNYTLELDYAFRARAIAKKLNNPLMIAFSNGQLSDSYGNLGEYHMAMKYWRESVKTVEQLYPDERPAVYGVSSYIFENMHQYDSALLYAKKSYELIKHGDDRFIKSGIFTALGAAFNGKGMYDSALFYYSMSLPFSNEIRMDVNKVDAYIGIAKLYKETNHFDSAVWYAEKALNEKIISNYPAALLKVANLLAATYKSKHNPDSTLKYLQLAINAKDSLFNREKTLSFQNIIFEEQEKQKDVEEASLTLQREYRTYFLIALFIILMTAAVVFLRNTRRKHLQNIRNSIADDLHDDIGSTLSSIHIMSELAMVKSPEALSLLTSIGESTNTIQENMSDIIWTIKATNDRFENISQRMNQFASEILDAKNIELDFKTDDSLSSSRLTMQQRKNFYLFFKEVINNTAKYADAKKVSVYIAQKNKYVEMNIADNGKGFDTAEIFNGNGMSTLKKRAAELSAHFKITSKLSEGTAVYLKFKIT